MPRGDRRQRPVAYPRLPGDPLALRCRGDRRTSTEGVGAPRRHQRDHRLLFHQHGAGRRRRLLRPVHPRRSGAARVRATDPPGKENLARRRRLSRLLRPVAAGPERQFLPRPFGAARGGDGPGARHQSGEAQRSRTGAHGTVARRGAERRVYWPVGNDHTIGQDGRRPRLVQPVAVDLR